MAILLCAAAAAVFTGVEALRWLQPGEDEQLVQELYAPFAAKAGDAQYVLKNSEGYVAVYAGQRSRQPLEVTGIELGCLRTADQAMIRAGLPVSSQRELLLLLEDLSS